MRPGRDGPRTGAHAANRTLAPFPDVCERPPSPALPRIVHTVRSAIQRVELALVCPSIGRPTFGGVPGARSHPRQASVHGGGLRGGCSEPAAPRRAKARSSLTGVPKPELAQTHLRPRNALLAAWDDASKLEGSVMGTVACCFVLDNAGMPGTTRGVANMSPPSRYFSTRCAIPSWGRTGSRTTAGAIAHARAAGSAARLPAAMPGGGRGGRDGRSVSMTWAGLRVDPSICYSSPTPFSISALSRNVLLTAIVSSGRSPDTTSVARSSLWPSTT
jgi:hypothetical protein